MRRSRAARVVVDQRPPAVAAGQSTRSSTPSLRSSLRSSTPSRPIVDTVTPVVDTITPIVTPIDADTPTGDSIAPDRQDDRPGRHPVVKTIDPVVDTITPVVETITPVVTPDRRARSTRSSLPSSDTIDPVDHARSSKRSRPSSLPIVKTLDPIVTPVVKSVDPVITPIVETIRPGHHPDRPHHRPGDRALPRFPRPGRGRAAHGRHDRGVPRCAGGATPPGRPQGTSRHRRRSGNRTVIRAGSDCADPIRNSPAEARAAGAVQSVRDRSIRHCRRRRDVFTLTFTHARPDAPRRRSLERSGIRSGRALPDPCRAAGRLERGALPPGAGAHPGTGHLAADATPFSPRTAWLALAG